MNRLSGILKKRSEDGEDTNNDDKPSGVFRHRERPATHGDFRREHDGN
ncbi:hypothetical protein [Leptospirillum ferrooxidans]|nr:hypothetical protein [Leptospirillum ferrooxidans]